MDAFKCDKCNEFFIKEYNVEVPRWLLPSKIYHDSSGPNHLCKTCKYSLKEAVEEWWEKELILKVPSKHTCDDDDCSLPSGRSSLDGQRNSSGTAEHKDGYWQPT
jgi:hypothetical protein